MIKAIRDDGRGKLDCHLKMNSGFFDRNRNFAWQQATYGPMKECLQGFLTYKERGTLLTRSIRFNVPILTGRGCKLDTPRTAKRTPHFGKRFTSGRKKTKWPYFYSQVTLRGYTWRHLNSNLYKSKSRTHKNSNVYC